MTSECLLSRRVIRAHGKAIISGLSNFQAQRGKKQTWWNLEIPLVHEEHTILRATADWPGDEVEDTTICCHKGHLQTASRLSPESSWLLPGGFPLIDNVNFICNCEISCQNNCLSSWEEKIAWIIITPSTFSRQKYWRFMMSGFTLSSVIIALEREMVSTSVLG